MLIWNQSYGLRCSTLENLYGCTLMIPNTEVILCSIQNKILLNPKTQVWFSLPSVTIPLWLCGYYNLIPRQTDTSKKCGILESIQIKKLWFKQNTMLLLDIMFAIYNVRLYWYLWMDSIETILGIIDKQDIRAYDHQLIWRHLEYQRDIRLSTWWH